MLRRTSLKYSLRSASMRGLRSFAATRRSAAAAGVGVEYWSVVVLGSWERMDTCCRLSGDVRVLGSYFANPLKQHVAVNPRDS